LVEVVAVLVEVVEAAVVADLVEVVVLAVGEVVV
jgi:hypothetical protein